MKPRLILEPVAGGGQLLGCGSCTAFRRHLLTPAAVTAEWARHLADSHQDTRSATRWVAGRERAR